MTEQILVTGGDGFLALHIIQKLLQQDFWVRATLRSLDKADSVRATLAAAQVPHLERLHFVVADLMQDAGWSAAMQGVAGVMSVAAPVFVNAGPVSAAVVHSAEQGTLRILKAAEAANVKRVVMTANLGAVAFSSFDAHHVITEADWTNEKQPGLSVYEQSKLRAEIHAWDYLTQTDSSLEFVTVNAGAMLGPALGQRVTNSFGIVQRLLDGKASPDLTFNVADVRDVADIHVRAMLTPAAKGQRFLAVEDGAISMRDMIELIKTQRPALATKLPKHLLPQGLIHLLAPINTTLKEADLVLRLNHRVSNQRARTVLGWRPVSDKETAVLAAVDCLQWS